MKKSPNQLVPALCVLVTQTQDAASSESEYDLLHVPTEGFVAVRELVSEPDTGAAAVVGKTSRRTTGYTMVVAVGALAAFVLGMVIGDRVHGHLAAAALR